MRSAKKPTAVSAATASITATTSKRSSPARKSRAIWRQARGNGDGGAGAGRIDGECIAGTYTTVAARRGTGVFARPRSRARTDATD